MKTFWKKLLDNFWRGILKKIISKDPARRDSAMIILAASAPINFASAAVIMDIVRQNADKPELVARTYLQMLARTTKTDVNEAVCLLGAIAGKHNLLLSIYTVSEFRDIKTKIVHGFGDCGLNGSN